MSALTPRERIIVLGLNASLAVGWREIRAFIRDFGGLEAALDRRTADRMTGGRWPDAMIETVRAGSALAAGERVQARAERAAIAIDVHDDDEYPRRLRALDNPPAALFRRGSPKPAIPRTLALVGSRRCSHYGLRAARTIAAELARSGVVVVSGLARGVDTAAHWGAVDLSAPTVAVMGSGHAHLYPPENEELVARMLETDGATLSEFSPDVPPLAHHFPRRNRILAALADAVCVIEAQEKSGALITTRWAQDLGKEVFVLPGQSDNPACAGSLALLRDGARCVRGAADILEDLGWGGIPAALPPDDGEAPVVDARERALLSMIDHEAAPLERIVAASIDPPGEVLTRLLSLELRGFLEQSPGMLFRRTERGTAIIARG